MRAQTPQMICTTVTGSASEIGWKYIFTILFKISKIHHASSKNSKENVVSRWEAFVKNSSTHPEIRDMRRVLANPRAFAGLGLAAVLVTIIQPFGLRVPGPIGLTLMYWLLMIVPSGLSDQRRLHGCMSPALVRRSDGPLRNGNCGDNFNPYAEYYIPQLGHLGG